MTTTVREVAAPPEVEQQPRVVATLATFGPPNLGFRYFQCDRRLIIIIIQQT
jgi:hypothetical protein